MNEALQYVVWIKPSWAPPSWLFGPVWTILYVVIVVTFGWVFYQAATRRLPRLVALPFALNLLFNLIFTPIQFGLRNALLASVDILLVVGTLIWALVAVYPYGKRDRRTAAVWAANIPYLLWGLYATALQLTVTYLNWK